MWQVRHHQKFKNKDMRDKHYYLLGTNNKLEKKKKTWQAKNSVLQQFGDCFTSNLIYQDIESFERQIMCCLVN